MTIRQHQKVKTMTIRQAFELAASFVPGISPDAIMISPPDLHQLRMLMAIALHRGHSMQEVGEMTGCIMTHFGMTDQLEELLTDFGPKVLQHIEEIKAKNE